MTVDQKKIIADVREKSENYVATGISSVADFLKRHPEKTTDTHYSDLLRLAKRIRNNRTPEINIRSAIAATVIRGTQEGHDLDFGKFSGQALNAQQVHNEVATNLNRFYKPPTDHEIDAVVRILTTKSQASGFSFVEKLNHTADEKRFKHMQQDARSKPIQLVRQAIIDFIDEVGPADSVEYPPEKVYMQVLAKLSRVLGPSRAR